MNYISLRDRKILSNEPYEISYDDIWYMHKQNLQDIEECKK